MFFLFLFFLNLGNFHLFIFQIAALFFYVIYSVDSLVYFSLQFIVFFSSDLVLLKFSISLLKFSLYSFIFPLKFGEHLYDLCLPSFYLVLLLGFILFSSLEHIPLSSHFT